MLKSKETEIRLKTKLTNEEALRPPDRLMLEQIWTETEENTGANMVSLEMILSLRSRAIIPSVREQISVIFAFFWLIQRYF